MNPYHKIAMLGVFIGLFIGIVISGALVELKEYLIAKRDNEKDI